MDPYAVEVGSPGLRFQVRAMNQAPWHCFVGFDVL